MGLDIQKKGFENPFVIYPDRLSNFATFTFTLFPRPSTVAGVVSQKFFPSSSHEMMSTVSYSLVSA